MVPAARFLAASVAMESLVRRIDRRVFVLAISAMVLGMYAALPATAANISWNAPAGGAFDSSGNWSPAQVPGNTDTAIFGLPIGTPDTYTVTFPAAGVVSDRLVIRDDAVTFSLGGGTYDVDNGAIFGPSAMEVGVMSGDDASMTLNSGTLAVAEDADIAVDAGSAGEVIVSTGATWTLGNRINVAGSGSASLLIENGGTVSSDRARIGAFAATAIGDVTVRGAGSNWTNLGNEFTVGFSGQASLTVDQQATITTGIVDIGVGATSTGTANVDGEGSLWTSQGSIFSVGFLGSGELNITGGGDVSQVNVSTFEVSSFIRSADGTAPDAGGLVDVDGAGSTWIISNANSANTLAVGDKGGATLDVKNGALVEAPNVVVGWIFSEFDPAGNGVANVSGGATLNGARMAVGFQGGTGTLNASSGAQIISQEAGIGVFDFSTGVATLTGAGTLWDSSDALVVGALLSGGTLDIEDGAVVNTPWAGAGMLTGSFGSITVNGAGSRLEVDEQVMDTVDVTGRLHIGGHDIFNSSNPNIGVVPGGPGGVGMLTVENGGRAVIGDMLKVWTLGFVTLNGGTVTIGTGPEETVADTLRIHSDGTLSGDGTVSGNVANDGAVAPGTSTGQLTINGSYEHSAAAVLDIEIGGLVAETDFDVLAVNGAATLAGTLSTTLTGGYSPSEGDSFQIGTFTLRGGVFTQFVDEPLPASLVLAPLYEATSLTLRTTILGDGNLSGEVEAGDYTIWANGFGTIEADYQDGDYSRNGSVGPEDYTVWANHFGVGVPPGELAPLAASAVPEPASALLALLGTMALAILAGRRPHAA